MLLWPVPVWLWLSVFFFKLMKDFWEIAIKCLVFGGEGLGYYKSKPVFVYGVLPNEKVLVRPVKIKSKFVKAVLEKVVLAEPNRRLPAEDHYLSCSPWQIMPEAQQLYYKKELTKEVFIRFAGVLPAPDPEITASPDVWHYRNKLEFGLCGAADGLSLCFNERYSYNKRLPLAECKLGHDLLNKTADRILTVLNRKKIPVSALKNLLVRCCFAEEKCLAALYVTDPKFETFELNLPNLSGWQIIYSESQTPSAVSTEILFSQGDSFLKEKFLDNVFAYEYDSFFQVNPPAFNQFLKILKEQKITGERLLDLYAGVGVIGLSLAGDFKEVKCVEIDLKAEKQIRQNAELNQLKNITALSQAAEHFNPEAWLKNTDTVVVDPPRAGLHPKVVKKLLEIKPKTLIYLSCNPATQARDFALLKEVYRVKHWQLFDFYPQTPHVESLLILES